MSAKKPITKADLHAALKSEFKRVRISTCATCEPGIPRRLGESSEWAIPIPACDNGCDRDIRFVVALLSQQYRLRDLTDTLS